MLWCGEEIEELVRLGVTGRVEGFWKVNGEVEDIR